MNKTKLVQTKVEIHSVIKTGVYNTGQLCSIMEHLADGKLMMIKHNIYGTANVTMNQQGNRISISHRSNALGDKFTEDNIVSFMMNTTAEWYIINEVEVSIDDELLKLHDVLNTTFSKETFISKIKEIMN